MRTTTAAGSIALAVACLGLGSVGTANASAGGTPAAATASCSTHRIDSVTAEGWCAANHPGQWRVGVQCNGTNYYTPYSAANGRKRKSCPAGTGNATHYWIDEAPAPQKRSNPRLRPPAIQGYGPGAIR
jgi:hypothetical protein